MKTWSSLWVWNGAQQTKKETTTAAESKNILKLIFSFKRYVIRLLPSIWKTDFLLPLLSFWSPFILLPRFSRWASWIFKPILSTVSQWSSDGVKNEKSQISKLSWVGHSTMPRFSRWASWIFKPILSRFNGHLMLWKIWNHKTVELGDQHAR